MSSLQKKASDPSASVWVSASAGTGKTKVLVDRLLNLLYQDTPVSHIVCLTFTKAAALEMRERLLQRLESESLLKEASPLAQKAAMILESILEAPESLKIMTMHGYCQGLLQKFPFEAGISPFFKILDDVEVSRLLSQALELVLTHPPSLDIQNAIEGVALHLGEYSFKGYLTKTFQKWHHLRHLQRLYPTNELFKQVLTHNFHDCPKPSVPFVLSSPSSLLQSLVETLTSSTKEPDQKLGEGLSSILSLLTSSVGLESNCPSISPEIFQEILTPFFLKKDGGIKARLLSAELKKKAPPYVEQSLQEIAYYLHDSFIEKQFSNWIQSNMDYWMIIHAVLNEFSKQKEKENALDYHDLILHSIALFSDDLNLSYLHQRLDYVIEHILIDEAQDNSPEQWLLIYKLVDLFIREDSPERTLFVVGDLKQSIYGFQGAAPKLFESLKDTFEELLTSRGHRFHKITLQDSYRTVPEILQTVDACFTPSSFDSSFEHPQDCAGYAKGMGEVFHQAFRKDKGWVECRLLTFQDTAEQGEESVEKSAPSASHKTSCVLVSEAVDSLSQSCQGALSSESCKAMLSPLIKEEKQSFCSPIPSEKMLWKLFTSYEEENSTDQHLAVAIVDEIENLLASKWIVPSFQRPIEPFDILVLMKNRGKLNQYILQELKKRNIKAEGPDRIALSGRLAIQDLMALLRFLSLPNDDWSLAHVLKSPLMNEGHGFEEEVLWKLCHGREGSLWEKMRQKAFSFNEKSNGLLEISTEDSLQNLQHEIPLTDSLKKPLLATASYTTERDSKTIIPELLEQASSTQAPPFESHPPQPPLSYHDEKALYQSVTQLKEWLSKVDFDSPYALIESVIQSSLAAFESRLGKDVHLLFEAFLDTVLEIQKSHHTLSEVLYELENSMPVIQRDPSKPEGVRIMTIHGSKGLEAPVVILADRKEKQDLSKEPILWPEYTVGLEGEESPLICLRPPSSILVSSLQDLRSQILEQLKEETNRLLYVALTRPRDGLCIIGNGRWSQHLSCSLQHSPVLNFQDHYHFVSPQHIAEEISIGEGDDKALSELYLPAWYTSSCEDMLRLSKCSSQGLEDKECVSVLADDLLQPPFSPLQDRYSSTAISLDLPPSLPQPNTAERGVLLHLAFEKLSSTFKKNHPIVECMLKEAGIEPLDLQKIYSIYHHPSCHWFLRYPEEEIDDDLSDHNNKDSLLIEFAVSEVEIVHQGAVYRIDRLVKTQDVLYIIDYKTGIRKQNQRLEKYYEQLFLYQEICEAFYSSMQAAPLSIKLLLLWIDEGILEEIQKI